jgi:outer membrane lipoprotein-sorting protein
MIKKILIAFGALILVFLVVVAFQSADYKVARSASIPGSMETVFGQINDLHKWQAWSPWAKLDPAATNTFEGPASGTGATFAWSGNSKIGEGRMAITESRTNDLVRIKLDFVKPFPSSADTEFTFKPDANQTLVTWTMTGHKNFISKAFCMFMNMDKMVGGDFEQGLANLRAVTQNL